MWRRPDSAPGVLAWAPVLAIPGPRSPVARAWRRTIVGLLWGGSLAFACTTVRDAWEARLIVPFWDEWDLLTVYRYTTQSGNIFAELWTPYNGHYEPVPRLLFLGRDMLLGGDAITLIAVCLALQGALTGIVTAAFLREPGLRGSVLQHVLIAASIVLLTWTIQMENFNWSVQITFVLPAFLTVAAIAILSWHPPGPRIDWPIVTTAVMAVVACLSLGAGLALWPALFVLALRQRRGAQAYVVTGIGTVLSLVPHWLAAAPGTTPMMALTSPIETLLFICRYLPPLYIRDDIRIVLGALLIGLGVFVVASGTVQRRGGRLGDLAVGLVAFGLYVAVLTALARAKIAVPASSRYMAFSSLYWVGLLAFGGSLAVIRDWRISRWAVYGVLLLGLEPVMTIQTVADEPFVRRADQATTAVLSMVAGTPDKAAIASHLHPDPEVPIGLLPFLKKQEYGFFGNRLVRAIGHPASLTFPVQSGTCAARVELQVRNAGLRVSGRYTAEDGPPWLVITGPKGNIRGLAVRERRSGRIVGYAPALARGTLFGVVDGSLCLAGRFESPSSL